jgi:predicted permease
MGALAVLQGVMLLVLLAVCGNMANLVLARASTRTHDVAVRLALGAGRARVISLMLTETLLLAVAGVALGIVFAFWGTDVMRAVPMPTPAGLQIRFDTAVDLVSLLFATLLGVGAGLVIGLAPALHLARTAPRWSARAGAAVPGRSGLRDGLMVVQVGLALVVLVIAAIFLQKFQDTQSTDPGFTREGVLLATYDLRGRSRPADGLSSADFARRLLERVRALPTVEAAAVASSVPLDIHGLPTRVFTIEGFPRTDAGFDQALSLVVTPGYFETMKIPIVEGRDFAALDDAAAAPAAIVNQTFVKRYVPSAVVLGRRLDTAGATYTIAGVVRDSLYNAYGEPPTPMIYLSFRDRAQALGEVHVRTRAGAEASLTPELRRILRELDPSLPLYNVRTLFDHVDSNLVFQRIPARLFAVIGPLILVLVAVGIYAVVSYTVTQRRRDISIRLALGARGQRVIAELVWRTLQVVGVGLVGGWAIAYLIDREIGGGGAASSVAFASVPALLLIVAALASWWPARRAGAIDPIAALKQE